MKRKKIMNESASMQTSGLSSKLQYDLTDLTPGAHSPSVDKGRARGNGTGWAEGGHSFNFHYSPARFFTRFLCVPFCSVSRENS